MNNQEVFAKMRRECYGPVEIQRFIRDHWDNFLANVTFAQSQNSKNRLNVIQVYNMVELERVNNREYCPLDGVLNPDGDPDLPTFYPGIVGMMRLVVGKDLRKCIHRLFEGTGINILSIEESKPHQSRFVFKFLIFHKDWDRYANEWIFKELSKQDPPELKDSFILPYKGMTRMQSGYYYAPYVPILKP